MEHSSHTPPLANTRAILMYRPFETIRAYTIVPTLDRLKYLYVVSDGGNYK